MILSLIGRALAIKAGVAGIDLQLNTAMREKLIG